MSMNIALSGLQASNARLSTISNNIANASTVGYVSSRSEFSSVYNNGGEGGGVTLSKTSQNFDKGGNMTYTGRKMDMAIQGEGFFMLNQPDGTQVYSKAGMFTQDSEGFLVDGAGNKLQGYQAGLDGEISTGSVGSMQIKKNSFPASATTKISQTTNLDARQHIIDDKTHPFSPDDIKSYSSTSTSPVYDSLGNKHVFTEYYTKTKDNEWCVHFSLDGKVSNENQTLKFDTKGKLADLENKKLANGSATTSSLSFSTANGSEPIEIKMDFENFSQFADDFATSDMQQNGYTSGDFVGVRMDETGRIFGKYSNNKEVAQGQILLANFNNPEGLVPTNNNSWKISGTSGQAVLGVAETGTFGKLKSGYLESSNVDTVAQMVDLIGAQQAYQGNAKYIQVDKTLTQTILNAV